MYANVISSNPDIIKKIEGVIDEYIELVIPGSGEFKKKEQESFIKSQSNALTAIYDVLKEHNSKLSGNKPVGNKVVNNTASKPMFRVPINKK